MMFYIILGSLIAGAFSCIDFNSENPFHVFLDVASILFGLTIFIIFPLAFLCAIVIELLK